VGALLTLYLVGLPLTLYAFVGMIMLIGIVKKNAIYDDRLRAAARTRRKYQPGTGHRRAALVRFRPS